MAFGKEEDNLFISGYFDDDFSIGGNDHAGDWVEWFVASLTDEGAVTWSLGSDGPRRDYAYELSVDTSGVVFVAGKYEGNLSIGGEDFAGIGIHDVQALLLGFDPSNGALVEWLEYGFPTNYDEGDNDDVFHTISIDSDNNFYLTGDFIGEVALDSIILNDDSNDSFFATKMSLSDCAYMGHVDFSFDGSACAGEPYFFHDDTDIGAHTISAWLWDFGNGEESTEEHPEHTFAEAGSYDVTLTVFYNSGGCELSTSRTVIVNPGNAVDAGPDLETCSDALVLLSGSMSGSTTAVMWQTLGSGTFADPMDPGTIYSPSPSDVLTGEVSLSCLPQMPDATLRGIRFWLLSVRKLSCQPVKME